jgi:hypothetical protein
MSAPQAYYETARVILREKTSSRFSLAEAMARANIQKAQAALRQANIQIKNGFPGFDARAIALRSKVISHLLSGLSTSVRAEPRAEHPCVYSEGVVDVDPHEQ